MRFAIVATLSLLTASLSAAQSTPQADLAEAYPVPFASEGNQIELAVANTASAPIEGVEVSVAEAPSWLVIEPAQVVLDDLAAGAEIPVLFTFSVVQSAPVGEVASLRVVITAQEASLGEKEILLEVEAPRTFALHSNYPNPFNPRTTIGYTLPQVSHVSLRIYDILGREVAHLVEDERAAGYHEAVWEAGRFASGVYVYRLRVEGADGGRTAGQRTMLLVK